MTAPAFALDTASPPAAVADAPAAVVADDGIVAVRPHDLAALLADGKAVVVDVREPDEYAVERIEGALLMPLSMFDAARFPRVFDRTVVLMCAIGKRSHAAARQMLAAGFDPIHHLDGGLRAWKASGLEVEE